MLDLDFKKSKDRSVFRKIMMLLDIENTKTVKKSAALQFFSLSNFLEIAVVKEDFTMPVKVQPASPTRRGTLFPESK